MVVRYFLIECLGFRSPSNAPAFGADLAGHELTSARRFEEATACACLSVFPRFILILELLFVVGCLRDRFDAHREKAGHRRQYDQSLDCLVAREILL